MLNQPLGQRLESHQMNTISLGLCPPRFSGTSSSDGWGWSFQKYMATNLP